MDNVKLVTAQQRSVFVNTLLWTALEWEGLSMEVLLSLDCT